MPDPNEAFDDNGVDLTLLAWFGTLSVLERLEWVCARSEELLALGEDAIPVAIPGGATILTASLATLALIKREVGRPKDLAMLQLIEARLRQG